MQALTETQQKQMAKIFSSEIIASERLTKCFNLLTKLHNKLFWMSFTKTQQNELYEISTR